MEQISQYIIEKLKISSNSKIKNDNINIKISYTDTFFSKEEFDDIISYALDLPIIPDRIDNGQINSKSFINLTYIINHKYSKKNVYPHSIIRIRKNGIEHGYIVRFIITDLKDTYLFPEDTNKKEYYESIEECFNIINEKWNELKFSEIIKKYK